MKTAPELTVSSFLSLRPVSHFMSQNFLDLAGKPSPCPIAKTPWRSCYSHALSSPYGIHSVPSLPSLLLPKLYLDLVPGLAHLSSSMIVFLKDFTLLSFLSIQEECSVLSSLTL